MISRTCLTRALLVVLAVTLAAPAFAGDPDDLPIDAAGRDQLIALLTADLKRRYIWPERAARIERLLRTRQKAHAYDRLTSSAALAEALTAEMREVAGDKHLGLYFRVRPYTPRTLSKDPPKLTAEELEQKREDAAFDNFGVRRAERLAGNVGLLDLRHFPDPQLSGDAAVAAMRLLGHTDALIIDLRGNGGGFPSAVALYDGWLLGADVHLHDLVWSNWGTFQVNTPAHPEVPRYPGEEVYVLVDHETISAGEQLPYDLQVHRRATIVGETTAGAANPTVGLPLTEHFVLSAPMGRAINAVTGQSWEGVGIKPDVATAPKDALQVALRSALTHLAAKAAPGPRADEVKQALAELDRAPAIASP